VIAESQDYQEALIEHVANVTGEQPDSFDDAVATFATLRAEQQRPLLLDTFFRELVASGREANADPDAGFERGYAAIDALLPDSRVEPGEDSPYAGDISLAFSRIYTLSGGTISLLAPGGLVNVGLANPPTSLGNRPASELGIVAQGPGDVRIFTNDDVLVNQSRVFTLGGGDIAIWSTFGDIDAGRGSKSAVSAPPPRVLFDADGKLTIDFSGAVAGSGIRTISTGEDVEPGDVDLIAPQGVVNAGDAGIGSAGNLNIAAQQVAGLDNIQVAGVSTGVPAETSGLGAALSGVSAAASSSSNTAAAAVDEQQDAAESNQTLAQAALSWLEVFVIGLGEENCKQDDIECLRRQTSPQ
jgi:filamentous hemagglutinin